MSWTAIVNGQVLDWGLANGFLGFDMRERKVVMFDGGKTPFSVSTLDLIAQTVASSLLDIEAVRNKYVYVASFTVSQNEILKAFEEGVDGKKWEVENVRSEDVVRDAKEMLRVGGDAKRAFRDLLLVQSYTEGFGNDFRGREFNDVFGLPVENLVDVVRAVKPGRPYLEKV